GKGSYVFSNYQTVETREPTGFLKVEALAPIIGSFSGLGGLLAGNDPVQWALAAIMVLAACAGIFFVARRF
ncbi:lysozyme family protein, partial [Bartonella callosciuri]|nr:lysozyme family protein [Bartonella callosciuri]